MSSGFPSDVLRLLCMSAAFYLAKLSPTTTRCCSFSLQAAHMLLSGTSMNLRVEAEQSKDIRGKTRRHFFHKMWPACTKIAVLCDVLPCNVKFYFSKPRVTVKLHSAALSQSEILFSSNMSEGKFLQTWCVDCLLLYWLRITYSYIIIQWHVKVVYFVLEHVKEKVSNIWVNPWMLTMCNNDCERQWQLRESLL